MNVKIFKSTPKGEIKAPPSKSFSHRYLISAMLCKNESTIYNVTLSDDILATLDCLKAFGCDYQTIDDQIKVIPNQSRNENPLFCCRESGSTLRFMIPISLTKYQHVTFKGSERLIGRGIEIYEEIFKKQGIRVTKESNKIQIDGKLKSGVFEVTSNISSQYITGLLFSLPLLNGDSVIKLIPPIYSKPYIDITLDIIKKYKIQYQIKDNEIYIPGNQTYCADNFEIEADFSNSAFLEAFNYFDGQVKVTNLNNNSLQGDKVYQELFAKLNQDNPIIDISNAIDLGPILFTFASLKNGATFINTERLRIKESDRVMSMKTELEKIGVKMKVDQNQVIIYKSKIYPPKESFCTHNDHRICMALSLLSTKFDIIINDAEVVKKSYPNYFHDLETLGVKIKYESIK